MVLTQAQRAMVEKARALGAGGQGVALSEGACSYLVGVIVADLGLEASFPEFADELPSFFSNEPVSSLEVENVAFMPMLERLVGLVPDADSYFECLAKLHKARLKYEKILEVQPIPSMEQVGPRGLLEFGKLSPSALGAYLFWRKWLFDIDNRAAQETGYLFEPIIAAAVGGFSASASASPVRRQGDPSKGRQVDCVKGNRAYEFKLRVTIAASGQGRWAQELAFPEDCRASDYTPVLVVLDSTPNAKLVELCEAFKAAAGESFVGDAAWEHLNSLAGSTMARFLDLYVHTPMLAVMKDSPKSLPPLTIRVDSGDLAIDIGDETFKVSRDRKA